MGWTNVPGNPRQTIQDFKDVEQYPLTHTSTAKKKKKIDWPTIALNWCCQRVIVKEFFLVPLFHIFLEKAG